MLMTMIIMKHRSLCLCLLVLTTLSFSNAFQLQPSQLSVLQRRPRKSMSTTMTMNENQINESNNNAENSNSNSNNNSNSNENNIHINKKPITTFGVLADIQYAPIPDGFSYGGQPRYYRHALQTAHHAAVHFEKECVDFVLNLGDIVDGKCQQVDFWCKEEKIEKGNDKDGSRDGSKDDEEGDQQRKLELEGKVDEGEKSKPESKSSNPGHDAVDDVLKALSNYKNGPILHTYGNHELYNLNRHEISNKLGIPFVKEPCGELVGYYSYKHQSENKEYDNDNHNHKEEDSNLRFVVIDSYDISIMHRCETTFKRQKAMEILKHNNPNYPEAENSPQGLDGVNKRYVAFNGAVGELQQTWLRQTLEDAKMNGEKVIILSHQPIMPNSSGDVCLIWNYNDILDILREYKCTIAAAFAGHAHKGGYVRDEESGIHFRVFEAVLEGKDPNKTYAFVDYHDDCLVVRGYGNCKSAIYHLDHLC
jgi:manganese-dependent ADP-ribose/CDP-alcohol diphosphatase